MKLLFIIGTRPEAIKLAPLIMAAKRKNGLVPVVCLTAQHREMLDQVINFFKITPDYDLNIMTPNQSLFDITSRLIDKLKEVILKEKPEWVIVQGDTTSTFVASLCGFYEKLKIAHIEAGLRTNDKFSPFPEEMNRILTTKMADIHFAPTVYAQKCLLKDGIRKDKIFITGNTGIDALFYTLKKIKRSSFKGLFRKVDFSKKMILITLHRRESFGRPLREICLALKEIALSFPDMKLVYPVHMNPTVQREVFKTLKGIPNVLLVRPVEYPAFVWLMKESYIILTDSGGIQEEAPSLGKPVFILRNVSERPETIKAGTAKLIGTSKGRIVQSVRAVLKNKYLYKAMSRKIDLYGDGMACDRIIRVLKNERS